MGIRKRSEPSSTARAVLVAGGASTRMGAGRRKPLLSLGDSTILEHTLRPFEACPLVTSIVLVAHADDLDTLRDLLHERAERGKLHGVIAGGPERGDSVRLGAARELPVEARLRPEPPHDLLAIHDAARPFVSSEAIERVLRTAQRTGAALLATPVRDTLKSSADGRTATHTVDRTSLWAAQTPQAFHAPRFRACLARAQEEERSCTDDAALWEAYEGPVELVPGSALNFKITDSEDLRLARALLADSDRTSE